MWKLLDIVKCWYSVRSQGYHGNTTWAIMVTVKLYSFICDFLFALWDTSKCLCFEYLSIMVMNSGYYSGYSRILIRLFQDINQNTQTAPYLLTWARFLYYWVNGRDTCYCTFGSSAVNYGYEFRILFRLFQDINQVIPGY